MIVPRVPSGGVICAWLRNLVPFPVAAPFNRQERPPQPPAWPAFRLGVSVTACRLPRRPGTEVQPDMARDFLSLAILALLLLPGLPRAAQKATLPVSGGVSEALDSRAVEFFETKIRPV